MILLSLHGKAKLTKIQFDMLGKKIAPMRSARLSLTVAIICHVELRQLYLTTLRILARQIFSVNWLLISPP